MRFTSSLLAFCSIFVLFVGSVCEIRAQRTRSVEGFEIVDPGSVELDAEKLKEIDGLMSREVEEGRIAGCQALVARGHQIAYFQMWGHQDREAGKEMAADTIFRIYSMSKPITSVATMQLVEQGKLQLDDPVSKYLPKLADLKVLEIDGEERKEVAAKREMTIRDLLRHTSGLTYGFFGSTPVDQAYVKAGLLVTDENLDQTIGKLSKIPLQYQPGTRWHYSVSTDVLGRVVEVASGQRFDEYLQEHIFVPLEMVDTFFVVPEGKLHRFAQMYRPNKAHSELTVSKSIESFRFTYPDNRFFSGGGGLCSTMRDYLRFCRALLHHGELDGKRIIKEETLREMTKNQLTGKMKRGSFEFGLGFRISPEGAYSWGGAAGTRFEINPKRDLITIYMIQIKPDRGDYGKKIRKIVYAADRSVE